MVPGCLCEAEDDTTGASTVKRVGGSRMEGNVSVEMPKYRCHKEVHALEIFHIKYDKEGMPANGSAIIIPAEAGYASFEVSHDYILRHNPEVGGYYVVYKDGYVSFSPKEAFEGRYTRI